MLLLSLNSKELIRNSTVRARGMTGRLSLMMNVVDPIFNRFQEAPSRIPKDCFENQERVLA